MKNERSHIISTTKKQRICDIYFQNFNETLTNDVVNFEQPAPGQLLLSAQVRMIDRLKKQLGKKKGRKERKVKESKHISVNENYGFPMALW